MLPNSIDTARFLKPDERIFAKERLARDRPSALEAEAWVHFFVLEYVQYFTESDLKTVLSQMNMKDWTGRK